MDFEQKTSSFSVSLSSVLLFRVVKFYGGLEKEEKFLVPMSPFFSFFLSLPKNSITCSSHKCTSLKYIYIINERLHSVLKLDYR